MAGTFDNSLIIQVAQANDIVELISEHVSLTKKGKEMVGLCPFHEDHRPSMNVNNVKQIFKCFACGAGGDVFKFVQMRENLTFPQAIERLAERAGVKIVHSGQRTADRKKPNATDINPNELARVNAWAAKYFQHNLHNEQKGKTTRNYIVERQITTQSVKKWQIGLAVDRPDDLIKAAKTRSIPMKLLEQAGLIAGHRGDGGFGDKFINRLMFAITDVTGRVIGFGGRTLGKADAKYINSPTTVLFDKSNSLYGLEQARHQIVSSGVAVVVEGYTDCIMAHQFGCPNVVATLGTSFTTGHARLLRRYAKKIVLIFDSDVAGIEAVNRALDVCLAQRIDIKLACLPEGKDPCDFLLTDGREQLEQLVENAVDVFEFKWNRLLDNLDSDDTIAGKKRAVEEFLQTIATAMRAGNLPDIERGLIVNRLSKIVGLDNKKINIELGKRLSRPAAKTDEQKAGNMDLGQGLFAAAQREILEVLLNEPRLFELIKQKITAELFDVPILKQIAAVLFESLDADIGASLREILAKVESVEIGKVITHLAQGGEEKGNFQSRLTGAVNTIQRLQEQKNKSQIRAIKDQTQFLRHLCENTAKENPHNVGMV